MFFSLVRGGKIFICRSINHILGTVEWVEHPMMRRLESSLGVELIVYEEYLRHEIHMFLLFCLVTSPRFRHPTRKPHNRYKE